MIGMLRGTVWSKEKNAEKIILDVGGIGYVLHVPDGLFAGLTQGEERVFYTHLLVREDDLILFGFDSAEEKDLFIQLLGVSGIGPKAALAILSTYSVQQVITAILQEDVSQLTKVPGIGGKTAKRLILELKEKIKEVEIGPTGAAADFADEAFDTLLALGFSRNEARETLAKVQAKGIKVTEDQVKEALRLLALPK
ncbi:MAG TPA: Holliday junction branch migration protein RuvA [Peptococcaceae bacterium]|nr:Holliday junction branch migration protein RuvA [Peptococcaceae bacterium]